MAVWKGIVGKGFTRHGFENYVGSLVFHAWRPKFVVLHNTASPKLAEWHHVSGGRWMHNLEHYYRDVQKWSAGPHLFVSDDLIWVFTPLTVHGVHSPSWNGVSWGVEVVGDYATENFKGGVRLNTIHALAVLHGAGGLHPDTLKFHKEDPRTTHHCPGKNIDKHDIIRSVQMQMTLNISTTGTTGVMLA